MNRTTLALLIAPALIPLGVEAYLSRGHSFGSAWFISAIYGFFAYLISLAFGGSIVDFLRSRQWTKLWHFTLAGFLLALSVGMFFVVLRFGQRLGTGESLESLKFSHHFSFAGFLPIGALMGATVWLIAEWRRPKP